MIKSSIEIPFDVDVKNPEQLHDFLVTMKQYVEELSTKAQVMQEEVRTTAPTADEIEEGEFVRVTVGANHHIYTKKGGVVKNWQLS